MTTATNKPLKRSNNLPLKGGKVQKPASKPAPAGKPAAKTPAKKPDLAAASPAKKVTQVHHLDDLIIDAELQQRAGGVDDRTVTEYATDLADGVTLPPICAVVLDDGGVLVWDGFQRIEAHRKAGLEEIAVEQQPGTHDDAMWLSCGANKAHGLRRKPEDKRKAIASALKLERTKNMSDRQIAAHCGGSPTLVGTIRKELVEAGEIADTQTRTTAAGKTIDTTAEARGKKSAAGKASAATRAPQASPAPELGEDDVADDAAEAESAGIDSSVGDGTTAATKPAKVTATVRDGILLDAKDQEVPEELHGVFGQVDAFHILKRTLDALAAKFRALCSTDAGNFLDPGSADVLEGLAEEVANATPYVLAENALGWEPTHPDKVAFGKEHLA